MSETLILIGRRVVAPGTHGGDPPRAVAVRDGRIVWVGSAEDAATRDAERVLDFGDGVILPGLTDAHGHLFALGAVQEQLDLRALRSARDAVPLVAGAPGDGWIVGRGWDQTDWPGGEFPDHSVLSAASPDRPVSLRRVDGHALWVNAAAMRSAGVTASTAEPDGGAILRDEHGEPTGILLDAAMRMIDSKIPSPTAADHARHLDVAVAACHRVGLTGMHDAGTGADQLETLLRRNDLALRVHVLLQGLDPRIEPLIAAGPTRGAMVDVAGVKLFADGALGSRGAWLIEPYEDEPGSHGIPVLRGQDLAQRVARFAAAGFQVGVHAIGDAAARDVLDAFEKVLRPGNDRRFRLEHAQVLQPSDRARMARLGVIASMQPTHATSDMRYAEQRLGSRIANAYAWRSMVRDGVRLALGSDFPVEAPDPMHGLWAASTRGGWQVHEALSRTEALLGFTSWAAFAAFADDRRGRIEPGLDADFTVLSEDPVWAEGDALREIGVLATVVGGRVVYGG